MFTHTSGGAVNFIPNRPDEEFFASAELSLGNYDSIEGRAVEALTVVAVPLAPAEHVDEFDGAGRRQADQDEHARRPTRHRRLPRCRPAG